MTQEIKTEKFEGLLVKVPDGNQDCSVELYGDDELVMVNKMYGGYDGLCALPDGKWKLIGNPFELSEEECKSIVDSILSFDYDEEGYYKNYLPNCFQSHFSFITAKESFNSLLKSLQVYKENPFAKPAYDDYSFYTDRNISLQEEWQEAEKRTGNWILLEKLNN